MLIYTQSPSGGGGGRRAPAGADGVRGRPAGSSTDGVLEGITDEWPSPLGRKAQLAHSASIWLSEAGLASTRVAPVAKE